MAKRVRKSQPETNNVECLVPGCTNEAKSRGLCGNCYTAARNAVKGGKTTWEKLEKAGLALASSRQESAFAKAFGELGQLTPLQFGQQGKVLN